MHLMQTRITPGQTLENAVTGERFTFTHTAGSTNGELLAFDFALRPGGAVPIPHVHPIQTERFEVVDGQMRFRIGLRTVLAGPGDVVEVAPGVAHSFANAGAHEARLRVEVRPALAMEDMFAEVVAMAAAGRMSRRGIAAQPARPRRARAPLRPGGPRPAHVRRRPACIAGAAGHVGATPAPRAAGHRPRCGGRARVGGVITPTQTTHDARPGSSDRARDRSSG